MQLNDWFTISRTEENIYCITERYYNDRLRANCWLLYNHEHSILEACLETAAWGVNLFSVCSSQKYRLVGNCAV